MIFLGIATGLYNLATNVFDPDHLHWRRYRERPGFMDLFRTILRGLASRISPMSSATATEPGLVGAVYQLVTVSVSNQQHRMRERVMSGFKEGFLWGGAVAAPSGRCMEGR